MSCFTSTLFIYISLIQYYFRYIVKKDAPGLTVTKIENKIGLRIVQNGDIVLRKVFVPDEDRIAGVNSFQDTNKVKFTWCFFFCYFNINCVVSSFQQQMIVISLVVRITSIT